MSTDRCVFFYDCRGCGKTLKPKEGDCCVFCSYLKKLLGKRQGIEDHLAYSIQSLQLADEQAAGPPPAAEIPQCLSAYIVDFDAGLTHDEFNSPRYGISPALSQKTRESSWTGRSRDRVHRSTIGRCIELCNVAGDTYTWP